MNEHVVFSGFGDVEQLNAELRRVIKLHYAPGSWENIQTQIATYQRFCILFGFNYFPADKLQICQYAIFLSYFLECQETVVSYVAIVRRLHEMAGFECPGAHEVVFHMVQSGLKRKLAKATKQAKPLTPELLKVIHQQVNFDEPLETVAYVALLVGFYLFLRKSNMVPEAMTGKNGFNGDHQFRRSDIRLSDKAVLMDIRWSKTLQYKQKVLKVPLLPADNQNICPVYWMNRMVEWIHASSESSTFSVPTKNGLRPLSAPQLNKCMKKWLKAGGEDPEGYSLHSLRRGGATWAAECNIEERALKLLGNWASEAYKRYIDEDLRERYEAMAKIMGDL